MARRSIATGDHNSTTELTGIEGGDIATALIPGL
jgi:hypothetical protein